jgi:hypothetical protein
VSPSQDDAPEDEASAADALKYGDGSDAARIATTAVARTVVKAIVCAAVETHCRNINVTMNDRLAHMDHNAH